MVGKKKKRELMERIIDLSETVKNREADPFEVEVGDFMERLDEVFRDVDSLEELNLDMQAMLGLTDIISQQEDWIKHKSSLLHFDPMLVTLKAKELDKKQLAYVLVNSWHPTVEMEAVSKPGIEEAIDYWKNLKPKSERESELDVSEIDPEEIDLDDISEFGFQSKEDFDQRIEEEWKELKEEAGEDRQISYWDWVDADSFRDTIKNAWLTSFLVSYGYAMLEINPLEEEIVLEAREEKKTPEEQTGTSVPISISYEDWKKRREQNA